MARVNGAALAAGLEDDEPTLRDQLEDARDQVVADQEGGDATRGPGSSNGAADGGDAGGAGRSTEASEGGAGGRARATNGRFAKGGAGPASTTANEPGAGGAAAPGAAAAVTPTAAELAAQDAAAGKVTPDPTVTADANLAPRLWSHAAKAEWSKLPESVRKEIAHREQAMHRQITAHDQEREIGRSFRTTFQSYGDVLQGAGGVHPVRLVEDALKVIRELQKPDPIAKATALGTLARQYGIDPRLFAGAPGGPAAAPPANGAPAAPAPTFQLPPAVAQMATEWNDWKASQARAAQEAQEAMAASVMTEIQSFQADPKNVYFDQVKDHMRVLLAGGAAQTMQEAYDQAIYARPDIRDRILSERDKAAAAEREKALTVERARRRNVSVRGRGGGAAPTTPAKGEEKTLRQELTEQFANARSRV